MVIRKFNVLFMIGMNFLAGILLMYLDTEEAFAGLVLLMKERSLREMYTKNMSLLQVQIRLYSKVYYNSGHDSLKEYRLKFLK